MKHVNLATIDLNLLKTFLAIWELRSLTAASERLHLSQPAVSHALRRLRETFDDPLFVRSQTAMVPTDAAARLHPPIDQAMSIIYGALQKHSRFEPLESTRTFRLVMSDMAAQVVLPVLMETLSVSAPSIALEVRQMPMDELAGAMRSGDADVALGYLPLLDNECASSLILNDEYVCVVGSKHPFTGESLDIEDMKALRYIYAENDTTGHYITESEFQRAGIQRDIALRLPHITVATRVIAATDLALILPLSIAEGLSKAGEYRVFRLPFRTPAIAVRVYTHIRFSSDPGITWMATTLMHTLRRDPDFAPHVAAATK